MPKGENMQTVSVNFERDYYNGVVKPKAESLRISANELIRRAVEEYVSDVPQDEALAVIVGAYGKLGKNGREWLMTCAEIAVGNASLRD